MTQRVGIINYNIGNIGSIKRSLEFFDTNYLMVNNAKDLKKCDKIILPGVGSFDFSMKMLKKKKLDFAIKNFFKEGKDILAICLGLQLLLTESEEFGKKKGLNILSGKVENLKKFSIDSPIPHIGWCMVKKNKNSIVNDSFETNLYNKYYYFAHGLICNFKKKYKFTKFIYGKKSFVASVRHKNLIGTQFHPELSGLLGLDIYKFFLDK
jgi:glutamine amidotransferase|tara:strand:- start:254 stop:880 length:627 start_codon:yes stop_codon:yes gene_type:complete